MASRLIEQLRGKIPYVRRLHRKLDDLHRELDDLHRELDDLHRELDDLHPELDDLRHQLATVQRPPTIYKFPDEALANKFCRHYTCYYEKNSESFLNSLCDKYGSDKGEVKTSGHPYPWQSHTYADFVSRQFDHCRNYITNVFECGIGTTKTDIPANMGSNGKPGASLRVWREYFPNANVFGADIDHDILFSEERIATFYCDQRSPQSVLSLWENLKDVSFDLMIDDGLHSFDAGLCLFENSFHKLKSHGTYIIEDVLREDLLKYKSYFNTKMFNYEFVELYRRDLTSVDNSLVVVRK